MKNFRLSLLLVFFTSLGTAQNLYFPPITGNTWDTISPATLGWCQPPLDSLIDYLGDNETKAFIILKDGKIVVEEYFGSFTQDSLWYWASAGKTLTSFLVGMAQQEGFLSINDTSSQYLGQGWSDCPPAKEEMITIKDHLSMTTGLEDGVPDNHCTLDTCLQYLSDAGTRWAYHNGPYTILDDVISNATGTSLNLYLTQKVKNPTGMNGFFLPSGYNNVYYSNARSMARFGLLMLNQGNWNGNQIMTDQNYFSAMTNTSQSINLSYGYLWWLNGKPSYMVPQLQFVFPGSFNPNAPNDMYAALGKNGQFINVVPSMGIVYIRMGNAPDGSAVPFTLNDSIWVRLNAVLCNITEVNNTMKVEGPKVFPNPALDELFFTNLDPGGYLRLLSMEGKVLLNESIGNNNSKRIDISSLEQGMYIAEHLNRQGEIMSKRKIVIVR